MSAPPNRIAPVNRRPAGQSDGSGNFQRDHSSRCASLAAVAKLGRWAAALAAVFFFLSGLAPAHAAAPASKLNVVLILADDLGWTDLACFGSKLYETPHIDRLARDGMKFTQAYAACCVCSPTRAAILTGKYPARLHVTDWIPGGAAGTRKLMAPNWTRQLETSEVTIAQVLHKAGYATASIGKWHLANPRHP